MTKTSARERIAKLRRDPDVPDGEPFGWIDDHGVSHEGLAEFIGVELLGFCGCGDPEAAMRWVRDVLRTCDSRSPKEHSVRWEERRALLGDGGLGWFAIYQLDHHGMLEHGGSVLGSWLTDDGEAVLEALEKCTLDDDSELVEQI